MELKQGVRILGIRPEVNFGIIVADGIWRDFGQELVITSGIEGKHSRTSRHYAGLAVDLRTRYFPEGVPEKVAQTLQAKLGDDFKVILERTHIHLSFSPRIIG